MTIPNDVSRCTGTNSTRVCPWRDQCARHVSLKGAAPDAVVSIMEAPQWRYECGFIIPIGRDEDD